MMMMIGVSLLFLSSLLRPKANSLNTGRESSHSSVRRFPRSTSHVNTQLHQAFHHYIKVISTHYEKQRMFGRAATKVQGYQMVAQSQLMHYAEDDIPEAKFSYDLSPMAVLVSSEGRRWYDFVTSLCAIVGGTFTVVGLLDNAMHKYTKDGKGSGL